MVPFSASMCLCSLLVLSMLKSTIAAAEDYCPTVSQHGDRRNDKTKLRVMEYNSEWLFTDSSTCDSTGCKDNWPTKEERDEHLQTVANYIYSLNADIVFLEEVNNCNVLKELIAAMPDSNTNYIPYMIEGKDTSTKQNCGLLTKVDPISSSLYRNDERIDFPISGNNCNYDGSIKDDYGCTKHFYTDFNINGKDIRMIGVHFLAHPDDTFKCLKREAQATVISNIIKDGINNNKEILVTGDFNDYDDIIKDAGNNVPITRVTKIIRESDINNQLINIIGNINEQNERYSCWWDRNDDGIDEGINGSQGNEHSLIDQFYISKGLSNYVTNVFIDHSYVNCKNTKYSDHWPIIVDFDLSQTSNSGSSSGNTGNTDTNTHDDICNMSDEIKTQAKQNAGERAIIDINNNIGLSNKIIGIGSGSTVVYAINKLGELYRNNEITNITCVPSSFQATNLIIDNNLPMGDLNRNYNIDIDFDGADQYDKNFNLIKGGGGCHLQEKMVAYNSKQLIILVDFSKTSQLLGNNNACWQRGIPVSIVPEALDYVNETILNKFDLTWNDITLRMAKMKAGPVVTDHGNLILDVVFGEIDNNKIKYIDLELHKIPGVIETGLFVNMADVIYIGEINGCVTSISKDNNNNNNNDYYCPSTINEKNKAKKKYKKEL